MFGYGSIREPVETASRALQHAAAHQTQEILARDAGGFHVARANYAEASCEIGDTGFGRLLQYVTRFSYLYALRNGALHSQKFSRGTGWAQIWSHQQKRRSRAQNPDRRIVMKTCGINGRGEWI